MDTRAYQLIAELFYYPSRDYKSKVNQCQEYLNTHFPKSGKWLHPFSEFVKEQSQEIIEETYIRTFDVQAICSIDVGYTLFGEDYKRGAILANLNKEHREAGNDCRNELADYLPNILKLVPLIKDEETRNELITMLLIPALDKVISEFGDEKIKAKEKVYYKQHKSLLEKPVNNHLIYRFALQSARHLLTEDFPKLKAIEEDEFPVEDFIGATRTEMKHEDSV